MLCQRPTFKEMAFENILNNLDKVTFIPLGISQFKKSTEKTLLKNKTD